MAWTKLSSSSVGAPALTAVNGSLTNVLRWALPILGFAIEFGATGNAAVFRAATGNRMRFCINNNAGASCLALVRAAETATSATAWGSVFPTTTQVPNANSVWQCGDPGDALAPLKYVIYGNGTFFYFIHQLGVAYTDSWEFQFFGDIPSRYNTGWETVVSVANNPSAGAYSTSALYVGSTPANAIAAGIAWSRGINTTTKSTLGGLAGTTSYICSTDSAPVTRGGYLNKLVRQKIGIHDSGSITIGTPVANLAIHNRGWLPNLWNPLHSSNVGAMSPLDTFTDTAYNPSASFIWYPMSTNSRGFIIEETDTWSLP